VAANALRSFLFSRVCQPTPCRITLPELSMTPPLPLIITVQVTAEGLLLLGSSDLLQGPCHANCCGNAQAAKGSPFPLPHSTKHLQHTQHPLRHSNRQHAPHHPAVLLVQLKSMKHGEGGGGEVKLDLIQARPPCWRG